MKKLIFLFIFCAFATIGYSQPGLGTIIEVGAEYLVEPPPQLVSRDLKWKAADEANHKAQLAQMVKDATVMADQLEATKERLKYVKEATEKLRKVNAKLRNLNNLESAVASTVSITKSFYEFMKDMEKDNLFHIEEYRYMANYGQRILFSISNTVNMLTIVLADYGLEGSDFERLDALNQGLIQLDQDFITINALMWEMQNLKNNRLQLRTLDYMRAALSGKPLRNAGK